MGSIKRVLKKFEHKLFLQLLVISLLTEFVVESFSRRHIFGGIIFMYHNPLMFIYSIVIIFLSYTLATFLKSRYYMYIVIGVLWLSLGVTNFILLGYRTTPLTGIDFYILFSVFSIIKVYLSTFMIILVVVLIVGALIGLIILHGKVAKTSVNIKFSTFAIGILICALISIHSVTLSVGVLEEDFGNLADAFKDYGFVYCFSNSLVDRGINEPESYSPETVELVIETVKDAINNDQTDIIQEPTITYGVNDGDENVVAIGTENVVNPNIIYLQLESFIDVERLADYDFSEVATPNFNALKEAYPSGLLTVPTIGAGTVNTEFEILTGMSLRFFGAGEYPYKSVLRETTVESICFNLDQYGYYSHGIHNNTGTFYSRHEVYPMLGFDSFSPIEYMNDLSYNPLGWVNDDILAQEIMDELIYTEQEDFIFITTMQSHGKYPDTVIDETQAISLEGSSEDVIIDEAKQHAVEYYANQLYATDELVGELIETLNVFEEPTIVVLYGDHLPSLDIEDDHLLIGNKFQTEYVLYSNYPIETEDKDLYAYQVSAYVMALIGHSDGVMTKLHQTSPEQVDYQDQMKLLQYDMLYGDMNAFDGVNPYIQTDMVMGIEPLTLTKITEKGELLEIEGEAFTIYSQVYVDDELMESYYVDSSTIMMPYEEYTGEESIYIAQTADNGTILSISNIYTEISISEDEMTENP